MDDLGIGAKQESVRVMRERNSANEGRGFGGEVESRGMGGEVPEADFAIRGGRREERDVLARTREGVHAVDVGGRAREEKRARERARDLRGGYGALDFERAPRGVQEGFGVAGCACVGRCAVVATGPLRVGAGQNADLHGFTRTFRLGQEAFEVGVERMG